MRQTIEPILDLLDEGLRLYRRSFAPLLLLASLAAHTDFSAPDIVRRAMEIAGNICVYSNHQIIVEELKCAT